MAGVQKKWGRNQWDSKSGKGKSDGKAEGKGDGKGDGKVAKAERKMPTPLSNGVRIDKTIRYTGKVMDYRKFNGYGWISLNEKGVMPGDRVFVHFKSIESEDRFPTLQRDMDVEFSLHPYTSQKTPGKTYVRAKKVTFPGGEKINVQDATDAEKKEFVGDQRSRYPGILKFYSQANGFGYVKVDDDSTLQERGVPKELRVEMAEVNAGGGQPITIRNEIPVEFGIWKTPKGTYKAYNMTLPGGNPVTQEAVENRAVTGPEVYQGTIEVNLWKQGYGFIKIDTSTSALPDNIKAKLEEMQAATRAKGKSTGENLLYFRNPDIRRGLWLKKGQSVQFQVYTDDKGAGAMDIH